MSKSGIFKIFATSWSHFMIDNKRTCFVIRWMKVWLNKVINLSVIPTVRSVPYEIKVRNKKRRNVETMKATRVGEKKTQILDRRSEETSNSQCFSFNTGKPSVVDANCNARIYVSSCVTIICARRTKLKRAQAYERLNEWSKTLSNIFDTLTVRYRFVAKAWQGDMQTKLE